MAGLIEQYIATLLRDMDFDPALARRFACEVEGHLRDAAEADPAWPSPEAERRAIERFGLARELAAQFAADAVERQSKRTWLTLLFTVLMTLLAMRIRVIWIDDGTASMLAPLIDRYAFLAAVGVAGVGWLAHRRSLLTLALCLGGLSASILAGLVRAELFTRAAPLAVLLPALGELALMALLSFHVVALGRRLRRTATLRRFAR
jgi:hypothetical protein